MKEINEILNRIKENHIIEKDKEVADILGISQQNLANCKKRNSIPYKEIISYCEYYKISMSYILTGKYQESVSKIIDYKKECIKIIENSNKEESIIYYNLLKNEELRRINNMTKEQLEKEILSYFPNEISTHSIKYENDEEVNNARYVYVYNDWGDISEYEYSIESPLEKNKTDEEILKELLEYVKIKKERL